MNWKPLAAVLADSVTHAGSRWRTPVAALPRHLFVPNWWAGEDGWSLRAGADTEEGWRAAAYTDTSLVTRVGTAHADHAQPGDRPVGRPTSSATLPSLLVRMFQHARFGDDDTLLDVGTGSGYGTALACMRLGERRVSSIDVDAYLTEAAGQRLAEVGLHPRLHALDASSELPDAYDRIVATVGVRPVPTSWLTALKPGGRLVTTIAGTTLIVTAEKQADGTAGGGSNGTGRVSWTPGTVPTTTPCRLASATQPARRKESSSPRAGIRWWMWNRRGTCRRCWGSRCPVSSTDTRKTGSGVRPGSLTRTVRGLVPPAVTAVPRSFTRAVPATSGTSSTRSAPTGFSTASFLHAVPTS